MVPKKSSATPFRSDWYFFIVWLVCCVTSFYCAGQISPSGGPPDLSPPFILETNPSNGQLHFKGESIFLLFNKYVDRTSFQQSCYISPPLGRLLFDWSGKEVEIRFTERLRDSTTYVLTVGTDLKDTRNNRLALAYSLAFSTGELIDTAVITGRVVEPRPEGVMIYAYRLDGINADTLNPSHRIPDYLTQTGAKGLFSLTNLALGKYRVIAVRDQYRNLLYDAQADEYGVSQGDIVLGSGRRRLDNINFRLAKEDTTPPFLSSARASDERHVQLKFNEPMRLEEIRAEDILVVDTATQARLGVVDFSFHPSVLNEGTAVVSPTESLHVYRVLVRRVLDRAGNVIAPNPSEVVFSASSRPDTLKPQVVFEDLADSARDVRWDDTLKLSFSKAVNRHAFEGGYSLREGSGTVLPARCRWSGSAYVEILPEMPMTPGEWYTLRIVLDSVRDYAGYGRKDSVVQIHFRVISEKLLGSLKGKVIESHANGFGKVHIAAIEVASKSVPSREIVLDSAGTFEFRYLQEGKYVFSAYRDRDGNGSYSFGNVFPFSPSEPFAAESDTTKVRARWPVEGVVIRIQ